MNDRSRWPWSTTVVAVVSATIYVLNGAAPDYPLDDAAGGSQRPTITDLTFDVFRHPSTAIMFASVAFFVPVALAIERAFGAAGSVAVAATYVVAGFAAGFVEMLLPQDTVAVVGGYGATTGVIAVWCVTRWRQQHDAVLPAAVTVAWVLVGGHLYAGVPWLGASAAALVGLYAIDALPLRPSTLDRTSQADRP